MKRQGHGWCVYTEGPLRAPRIVVEIGENDRFGMLEAAQLARAILACVRHYRPKPRAVDRERRGGPKR